MHKFSRVARKRSGQAQHLCQGKILLDSAFVFAVGFYIAGECIYPDYLQSGVVKGELQPWKTRTWWINVRDKPRWKEREEIYVDGSNMWYQRETDYIPCEKKTRRVSQEAPSFGKCVTRTLLYNRTCLIQEGYNKYRIVQYTPGRSPVYICMMYIKRSNTVIQTIQGPMRDKNVPDLCNQNRMILDKWPWIATWKPQATDCPISGGFTFRTISRLTNQDICETDWRRSKLEIECVKGDGLDFIAPKGSRCNPFLSHGEHKRLYCWAGWEFGQYIYMVASGEEEDPQFCIRIPKKNDGEFVALVYFSVICPVEDDGQPPTGFDYYELHLQRTDPNECKDENREMCAKFRERGVCDKPNNKFVQHCKKSCNICENRAELLHKQCQFDDILHGQWVLYDRGRHEQIYINNSVMSFSHFGTFHCKERTQEERKYKLISVFDNGCTKRYSCIELNRRNNNILQYRIGHSLRQDEEFGEICQFHDDPYPLIDTYRSSGMKNLILNGRLWDQFCGLRSTIPFNGTFNDEECYGYISDWDDQGCVPRGTLKVSADNCLPLLASKRKQYQCLLFLKDQVGLFDHLLITRSMDGRNEFNCWVISQYAGPGFTLPYRVVYQMPTPQCSSFSNVYVHVDRRPKATLQLMDDRMARRCIPTEREAQTHRERESQNVTDVEVTTMNDENREVYSIQQEDNIDETIISVAGLENKNQGQFSGAIPIQMTYYSVMLIEAVTCATMFIITL
ncbi:uncharacterized protein LOC110455475 [Mizuhopecten yessoensis]|uniref:uncharacterized protein LOC110455475 n=1 Tax=Mizuhopecten yessoensis TaxID=6573 RepID=UPI000B45753E|nr:uncharacterized protein LOC110455475 [Mizuhopecten yessoensis]